jgi:hypothetical protein
VPSYQFCVGQKKARKKDRGRGCRKNNIKKAEEKIAKINQ